ncbi:MAG TPA: hypothetical protein VJG32_07980 [Anaerolineae bacterium]|nr:hypothetical protein [Anaerolineae bacterium]
MGVLNKTWACAEAGQADPDCFGIFNMQGLGFVRGNVIRDVLALNKIEILPWDHWALMSKAESEITEADLALLDRIAGLALDGGEAFSALRSIYENDERVRVPHEWQA